MSDIGTYIGSVLLNFWTVVAGVMIAVEPVTRFLWHGYDEWAANWLSAARRKNLGSGLIDYSQKMTMAAMQIADMNV